MYRRNKDNLYSLSIITPFRILYLIFFMIFLYSISYIDLNSIDLFSDIDIVLGKYIRKTIRMLVIGILPFSYISIKVFNTNERFYVGNYKYKNELIDIVLLSIIGILVNFELLLKDDIGNYIFLRSILGSINMLFIFYKIFRVSFIKHYMSDRQKDLSIKSREEYEIIFNKTSKIEELDEMKFVFEYYEKTS